MVDINNESLSFLVCGQKNSKRSTQFPIIKEINMNSKEFKEWFRKLDIELIPYEEVKELIKTVD